MSTHPVYFAHTEHPADPQTHEPIIDHAVAVSNHCMVNTPADTTLSDGTPTRPVLYVMAWCHDLAKLTTWWQEDHDNPTVPSVDRPAGRVGSHSFFGGVATWWVLRELGYPVSTALPAAIAVSRHHGTLPDFEDYTINQFVERAQWETVRHQLKNIDSQRQSRKIASQAFDHLLNHEELYVGSTDEIQQDSETRTALSDESDKATHKAAWQTFVEAVETTEGGGLRVGIKTSITGLTGVSLEREYRSISVYHDLLELYGGLKGADTPASAGLSPADQTLPAPDVIDDYVQSELSPPTNPQTPVERLNAKREEIRQDTLSRVDRLLRNNLESKESGSESAEQRSSKTESDCSRSGENYSLDAFGGDGTQTNLTSTSTSTSGEILPGVYTLTLPTGAGKTLTGTQAALKFHQVQASDGPLIHILPYTSIIEQTESVYQTLFDLDNFSIGVDHYLADNTPDEGDSDTDADTDSDDLLETAYRSWHTDITLSTTVQLWESLYGPSKSQATKLPQFYNSTIIIDEPQTTPPTWWNRVEQLVDTLNSVFNATVILMSATHPPLEYPTPNVGPDGEAELAPSVSLPDNVTVTLDASVATDTPIYPESAATHLQDEIVDGRDSILSIHNTISNARAVTESLIGKLHADSDVSFENIHTIYTDLITDGDTDGEPSFEIKYDRETIYDQLPSTEDLVDALITCDADVLLVPLTTRNRPCDRSRILDALSNLLERYPRSTATNDLPTIVALTTQLIEAGVDISFESLFRDIAPYDSLVQAAGRCNRNYEYGIGNGAATIWKLNARRGANTSRIPAEYVYNQSGINELHRTIQSLDSIASDDRRISQTDFLRGYTHYRNGIIPQIPDQTQQMDTVSGAAMTIESLIDDDRPEITVYVSQSPAEDRLLEAYRRADKTNNIPEQIAIRECLRHIACDVPRNRRENPITECAYQLNDDLYFLDSTIAAATNLYGWKGLSNDLPESNSGSHQLL